VLLSSSTFPLTMTRETAWLCCGSHKFASCSPTDRNGFGQETNPSRTLYYPCWQSKPLGSLSLYQAGVEITDIASVVALIDTQELARSLYKADKAG
jgi:hypothetical protein